MQHGRSRRPTAMLVALLGLLCLDRSTTAQNPTDDSPSAGQHGGGVPGSVLFTNRPAAGVPIDIWRMNADGSGLVQLTTADAPAVDVTPDWSPDGRRIVFTSNRMPEGGTGASRNIFLMNADGSDLVRLTSTGMLNQGPVWAPNGKQIAFYSNRNSPNYELYVMNADGTDVRQLTDPSETGSDQYPDWSPDGRTVTFQRDGDIWVVDVRTGSSTRVWDDGVLADMPDYSPTGKRIAFMSRSQGGCAVFVMDASGENAVNLTPRPPDVPEAAWCNYFPSWSKNGQQIYYGSTRPESGGDGEIMVIDADGRSLPTQLTTFGPGLRSAPVMR